MWIQMSEDFVAVVFDGEKERCLHEKGSTKSIVCSYSKPGETPLPQRQAEMD